MSGSDDNPSPLVSIVIPCFNAERTVRRAVESALSQSYSAIEVIAIDDGSSDGTLAVLEEFSPGVRVISGPNAGAAAARNRGIHAAAGEFVQFLDADDMLLPSKVEVCVAAYQDLDDRIIPVTDCLRRAVHPDREEIVCFVSGADAVQDCLSQPLLILAPLHRRAWLLEVGGFRENLRCCQEKDLHLRLAAHGYRFSRIPRGEVVVFETEGSLSSDNRKVLRQRIDVYENLVRLLSDRDALTDERRRLLAASFVRDGFDLCRWERPAAHWAWASSLDPVDHGRSGPTGIVPRLLVRMLGLSRGAAAYAALSSNAGYRLLSGARRRLIRGKPAR